MISFVNKFFIGLIVLSLLSFFHSLSVGAQSKLPFGDISNSFAKNQIVELYNQQFVVGVGDRKFAPERSISRAEFAVILTRILHLKPVNNVVSAFSDVSSSAWYYPYIHALYNIGIVQGTGIHTYDPQEPITRQEAAALIVKALKQKSQPVQEISLSYKDFGQISSWAIPYVVAADNTGVMIGYSGHFRPLDPISRQEAAMVFSRVLEPSQWVEQMEGEHVSGIQLGWMYNQTNDEFKKSVQHSMINTISPRWFFLNEQDQITNHVDPSLVEWAHSNGKKVWPLVANNFDQELTSSFLSQEELRNQMVTQLTEYVTRYNLDGLNIDFENIAPEDRDVFTLFIQELASKMHEVGAVLSVCVPPDTSSDWSDPYDYVELAKSADYLVMMGYEEHWSGSPKAGSVSSLPWLQSHIDKLVKYFPANQLIVGLPLYTRDWSIMNGKMITTDVLLPQESAMLHTLKPEIRWNAASGQYLASYWKNGIQHQIWLEESRSLSLKYLAGQKHKAAGFAYWHVGGGTDEIWTSLDNANRYSGYTFSTK